VSRAIVYGWYPVAVALMVAGVAWAGMMAARAQWRAFGTVLAVAVVGAGGVFAGPVGAWAVAGMGLCVAAAVAWWQRS
jgi:hypothetical protein